jgi:hypothetical protein
MVALLVFGWWDVSDRGVQAVVVVPAGPLGGRCLTSVLNRPIVDSIVALSSASPTVPMEPVIPASIRAPLNAKDVYWPYSTGGSNRDFLCRA